MEGARLIARGHFGQRPAAHARRHAHATATRPRPPSAPKATPGGRDRGHTRTVPLTSLHPRVSWGGAKGAPRSASAVQMFQPATLSPPRRHPSWAPPPRSPLSTAHVRPEARGAHIQTNHITRAHGSPHWVPSPLSLSLPLPLDSLRHQPSRAVRGPRESV